MKKWFAFGIVGLLALGALAMVFTTSAFAQEDTTDPTLPGQFGRRHGPGRGMGDSVSLEAAAEALGMTTDELSTQLWGGKSLADLAEEKGVALEDVQAAVEAAQEQAFRDEIAQAVEEGTITQEHADWLLEGLEKGFIGGPGRGLGFHGHGFGLHPEKTTVTSSGDV